MEAEDKHNNDKIIIEAKITHENDSSLLSSYKLVLNYPSMKSYKFWADVWFVYLRF